MILTELYDNPVPFKWQVKGPDGKHDVTAKVEIGGRTIQFYAEQHGDNWSLQFAEVRKAGVDDDGEILPWDENVYELTGKGDEMKVFATLKKFTEKLIQTFECPRVIFTADKTENKGSKRADLYDRMFRRFKFPGYTLNRQNASTIDTFQLCRDGVEPNEY